MTHITGGAAIVQSLIKLGVDTIFALPGVQNDHFFNALYEHTDHIRVIHTRHEQGAAYMAMGYSQSTGKPGVYCVVPGPGFLNTTGALSTAYAVGAKVLCLTGQIPSDAIGKGIGLLHEIPDQLGVIRSLTKWAERIESPEAAPGLVTEAFSQLYLGPAPACWPRSPDGCPSQRRRYRPDCGRARSAPAGAGPGCDRRGRPPAGQGQKPGYLRRRRRHGCRRGRHRAGRNAAGPHHPRS